MITKRIIPCLDVKNGRVVIYTRKMEFYAEHEVNHATHIFQQEDGSVLAVGDTKAVLVMP